MNSLRVSCAFLLNTIQISNRVILEIGFRNVAGRKVQFPDLGVSAISSLAFILSPTSYCRSTPVDISVYATGIARFHNRPECKAPFLAYSFPHSGDIGFHPLLPKCRISLTSMIDAVGSTSTPTAEEVSAPAISVFREISTRPR